MRRFHYAFPSEGRNPAYWRLTRRSYRLINGLSGCDPLPRRSFFSPMGVSLHFHSHHLADVVVKLLIQAQLNGLEVAELSVETSLLLDDEHWLVPDATLSLFAPDGRQYRFFIELDTASERVSTQQRIPSSIQKKLFFYERYRQSNTNPFRVLFVTTSSKQRALNILRFGSKLTNNRAAQSVYTAHFPDVMNADDCLQQKVFRNFRLEAIPLVVPIQRCRINTAVPGTERIVAQLSQKEYRPPKSLATIEKCLLESQCSTESPHCREFASFGE